MASWHYGDTDVEDLKLIYYDYIQFMYNKSKGKKKEDDEGGVFGSEDSKDYRTIGKPSKKESLFCADKSIWEGFRDNHFTKIDPIRTEFTEGNFSIDALKKEHEGIDLNNLLKQRDQVWAEKVGAALKENLGTAKYQLQNFNNQNEPEILLRRALSTLESIDTQPRSFYESAEVEGLVTAIGKVIWDFKQAIKDSRKG
jgi:hypothetical protein